MSKAYDAASDFLDRVIDGLDNPTQHSQEVEFAVNAHDKCWRCFTTKNIEDTGLCEPCRLFLAGEDDSDPAEHWTNFDAERSWRYIAHPQDEAALEDWIYEYTGTTLDHGYGYWDEEEAYYVTDHREFWEGMTYGTTEGQTPDRG